MTGQRGIGSERGTTKLVSPRFVGIAMIHLTGWAATAVVLAIATVGIDHIRWLVAVHQAWGDSTLFVVELAVHLFLSALGWAVLYVLFRAMVGSRRGEPRLVVRQRGTAITETIIVMPVLLLIILGVSQLAVNNVANMLLNYGSTQAARTVWVWAPETEPVAGTPRMGVNRSQVEEMARLQAAAVMTPVAPSAFSSGRSGDSLRFDQMRAILLASQMRNPPNDSGNLAMTDAEAMNRFDAADSLTFVHALDGSSYQARTVRKFTSAYHAVDLQMEVNQSQVGVQLTYHHQITFPLVGPIFGSSRSVGGAAGYYMPMHREAYFRAQIKPNAELPRR